MGEEVKPYYEHGGITIYHGDCREILPSLPVDSALCCVTSPPYWGLRDYGNPRQIGLERTPTRYVSEMVSVFRSVNALLESDGTLWLNLGDTYYRDPGKGDRSEYLGLHKNLSDSGCHVASQSRSIPDGCKPKDLVGIPWLTAFALRDEGWYLRSDIVWAKPNPMPEPVADRPTKSHEFIFLMSKNERYHCNMGAIKEPFADERDGNP